MTERDSSGPDRDRQADLHGDDRGFDTDPPPRPGAGPRSGARSPDYDGRGVTGGYGQNGSDPGRRVSSYGDRVYRGGGGGAGRAEDYSGGATPRGADRPPSGYEARYGGAPPQAYQPGSSHPGYRGLGPKGYTRSDPRISEDVHDQLTEDDHIDASGISVAVQDGEVTLSGMVRDRRAKHHAEVIVEHISGVKHVQNNLRLDPAAGRAPAPLDRAEGDS